MSVETKTALDAALAAHVADECDGAILTGYVTQTQFTTMELLDDGYTGYQRITAENQNLTATIGLMHYGQRMLDVYVTDLITSDDDD